MVVSLRDMQENVVDFGIKEVMELIDLNPEATDEQIKELVKIQYGHDIEDDIIILSKIKF